jgi:hypothetical protein
VLVGNLLEGSNVVSGTLLEPFVAENHDSSGQEVALQSNRVFVVFFESQPKTHPCVKQVRKNGAPAISEKS